MASITRTTCRVRRHAGPCRLADDDRDAGVRPTTSGPTESPRTHIYTNPGEPTHGSSPTLRSVERTAGFMNPVIESRAATAPDSRAVHLAPAHKAVAERRRTRPVELFGRP